MHANSSTSAASIHPVRLRPYATASHVHGSMAHVVGWMGKVSAAVVPGLNSSSAARSAVEARSNSPRAWSHTSGASDSRTKAASATSPAHFAGSTATSGRASHSTGSKWSANTWTCRTLSQGFGSWKDSRASAWV